MRNDEECQVKIGERLVWLRKSRGIKQCQAADIAGVTRQGLGQWEHGDYYPTLLALIKLADFYGCSVDFLLCRVDHQSEFCNDTKEYLNWEASIRQDEREHTEKRMKEEFTKKLKGVLNHYER